MGAGRSIALLERESELAVIDAAAAAARRGDGQAVVVRGAAGIGKSALLEAGRRRAEAAGATVLAARAGELEQGFPWGVARQLLTAPTRDRLVALDGAAALAAPLFGAGPPDRAVDDDRALSALVHGLYWLTADLCERGAVVLVIDDLQWADQPSQRFLAHLLGRADELPLLLLAAVRTGEDEGPVLRELLAHHDVTLLRPAPLGTTATAALIRRTVPEAPGELCDTCHELTGGNPFLLRELAAELVDAGVATPARVRALTPDLVLRRVTRQLAGLPPGATEIARAVALLGPDAELRRAAAVTGLDGAAAARAASALIRAELLVEGDVLAFSHPLVRSTVVADLSGPLRARMELTVARLLAAEGADATVVASHLLGAAAGHDPWVVATLRDAAAASRARGAPQIAAEYLRRALREPPPSADRAELTLELGTVLLSSDPEAARHELRQAQRLATAEATRRRTTLALAQSLVLASEFNAADELLAADGDDDPAVVAARLTATRLGVETQATRRLLVRRLRERAAGTPEGLDSRLAAVLAIEACAAGDDADVAAGHARRAIAAPEALAGPADASLLPEVVGVLVFAERYADADAALVHMQETSRGSGWVLSAAATSTVASIAAAQRGAIADAAALASEAVRSAGETWIGVVGFAHLLSALVERDDAAGAWRSVVDRGVDGPLPEAWSSAVLLHHRARVAAALGDLDSAIADLRRSGELATAWGVENPAMMPWRSQLAVALAARGELTEAQRLASVELELAHRWGAPRPIGIALHAAGVAAGRDGGPSLSRAVEVLRGADAPLELARALAELGSLARRTGNRKRARELLRESLDIAHHCGAIAVARRSRRELRVAGARPRRDALRGRDALTASELRVAQMAAEGMTNRAIAQALFVTRRTVELHLTNVYTKLGVSRADLSTALHEHRQQRLRG
jgi:DNA-binding CsgD family transcriptional regulator